MEDAFIKIAEADIREEESKIKEIAQRELYMSPEDEEKAMQDYFEYEGRQNCCQKICVVLLHRLQLFYRSGVQWVACLLPLAFVSMMCFCFYSIVRSVVKDPDEVKEVVPIMLKIIFGIFLTIGYTFTAGISAVLPMKEKQGGLRHMMHLFGLNSFEYFLGMAIADWVIVAVPATVASLLVLIFDEIMMRKYVWEFWIIFMFFGCAMNVFSYLFSHLFSNPDTAVKYISLIYSLGLFFGPLIVTSIIAGIIGEDQSFQDGFSFWFFFSPLCTFWLVTQNVCYRGTEDLEDKPFEVSGGRVADMPLAVGVFSYQILLIFTLTVLIDSCKRNGYKRRGGKQGALPPHLDVRQDVLDHEEQVRLAQNLPPTDPDYLQIRAVDLSKTYPNAKKMAVCRNTFGAKQGEVYGLLGPNGAGKSTTFSMMAMQIPISSGEAELMNYGINQLPLGTIGKYFGICNQENLMWEDMTVNESLNLVASLKGVNGERRDVFKRLIMQNLDLTPFK